MDVGGTSVGHLLDEFEEAVAALDRLVEREGLVREAGSGVSRGDPGAPSGSSACPPASPEPGPSGESSVPTPELQQLAGVGCWPGVPAGPPAPVPPGTAPVLPAPRPAETSSPERPPPGTSSAECPCEEGLGPASSERMGSETFSLERLVYPPALRRSSGWSRDPTPTPPPSPTPPGGQGPE